MVFAARNDERKQSLLSKLEVVVLFFDSVQLKLFISDKASPLTMLLYKWDTWKVHASFTLPGNPTLAHRNL